MKNLPQKWVGKAVYVEWVDSHYGSGWNRNSPIKEPLLSRSVAWVSAIGEKGLTLTGHITVEDDPQREGEMTIPIPD